LGRVSQEWSVRVQRNLGNGKREGLWETYHKNGQLLFKGTYKNGKKDGVFEKYWDNGQLDRKEITWKNGRRDGVWEFYDKKNGQLKKRQTWMNGIFIKEEKF